MDLPLPKIVSIGIWYVNRGIDEEPYYDSSMDHSSSQTHRSDRYFSFSLGAGAGADFTGADSD
jgi:hypothetical protein